MPLRDLGGTGLSHALKRRPDAKSSCERLTVPAWFFASRERMDLEARGFVNLDRDYPTAKIDAAVSDAFESAFVDLQHAEAGYAPTAEKRAAVKRNKAKLNAALAAAHDRRRGAA